MEVSKQELHLICVVSRNGLVYTYFMPKQCSILARRDENSCSLSRPSGYAVLHVLLHPGIPISTLCAQFSVCFSSPLI